MQSFGQILPKLLLDLHADNTFINFNHFSLRVRVGQNIYWVDRKDYVFEGYHPAVSDLKGRQFFSQTSASIKYAMMF